jgi:hypothetical protein
MYLGKNQSTEQQVSASFKGTQPLQFRFKFDHSL